ncbi:unnamed protein product [Arabidopsis arenosa]|uniref:Malectin-like domain-containing protein n=1 Tax=Arabidopsis arenosa TaxID=38785 RepID=A0A8S2A2D5_ARAAE|nr:unnamed protein product [Arabidopsis arenosa]
MEGHGQLLLALSIGAFAILHIVHAQPDQQGFISLDCGLSPGESPYTDPLTGLRFTSDADFIKSGKRSEVGDDEIYTYRQFKDLRYFPDGIRNCYNLTVTLLYDIRHWMSKLPLSSLDHVNREKNSAADRMAQEALSISSSYRVYSVPPIHLLPFLYPDDVLDRIWDRYNWFERDVNTTLNVTSSNPFAVPDAVSRSGVSPTNSTRPLNFYVSGDEKSNKLNVYFHFAEIEVLKANDTREFDILLDDIVIHKAYSPKVLQSETIYNISPQRCRLSYCDLDLIRTPRSTLPPLINAIEAFKVLEFQYAETNQNDVAAMKNIEAIYGLNMISWQGDPCVPEVLKWEGLMCRYTNKSIPPRIISLDLSSRGLKGIITPAFQNLTELQKL